MKHVLRPLLLTLLVGVASNSFADRVITIPMGRKIPFRSFKIDTFEELSRGRTWDRFIGVGVSPEIEVAYHGERIANGPARDTFDVSYNYVTPIINAAPGLSVGVQDVLNRTRDHRRYYVAATWRMAVDNVGNGNLPMDVTLGISQTYRLFPMVGVSIPFSENLRLLVEDNGARIASGFELRLFKNAFGARFIVRDQTVMVGANLTLRF